MELFDKLGEFAKIAANKTEEITKTIGEKAEAAMEIQKLTSLVSKEESKIESKAKLKAPTKKWAKWFGKNRRPATACPTNLKLNAKLLKQALPQ